MPQQFELRKEIELKATPEQVWDAIATGPGVDAWFMGRNEIEAGEGGAVRLSLAGHTSQSTVTAWEPGRRLAHSNSPGPDGSFLAFEYLIEARGGGSTVMRLVQSGVLGGDNWETEYEAMKEGWDMYLHSLGQYLTHFPGRSAQVVSVIKPQAPERDQAWDQVKTRLGLTGTVSEGDPVRLALTEPTGVVRGSRLIRGRRISLRGAGAPAPATGGTMTATMDAPGRVFDITGAGLIKGISTSLPAERVTGSGLVEGVVDYAGFPTFLGVRTDQGLFRFIHSGADRGNVMILGHHIFDDVNVEQTQYSWQSWLDRTLVTPEDA
ncbi:SRPBCC domain-containing protein [Sphaerisporangium sp. TRM90804]|uniref:SRPBCC family protein n=1 Tax=Sphaerisporangium sp. TRM90804 TaxID=3031113 RepID=UPI00244BA313|nr:SRPBCC domain-containing protein [Sphaerisporangium sp. TRM90804]MDH2426133.1 SRPBCC domain-containing protein [Sphaerisporangium sp. TRM90804]